jgi:hypothetical protein
MWTYWPLAIAGTWMFWMGAIIAAPIADQAPGTIDAIRSTGDDIFTNFARSCCRPVPARSRSSP